MLFDVVYGCLSKAYGEHVQESPESPTFIVSTTRPVLVRVSALSGDASVVDIATWLVRAGEVTQEMQGFLLRRAARLRFGKPALDQDGDIILEHSLFSESFDCAVLVRLVELISSVASDLERELVQKYGKYGGAQSK